MVWLSPTRQADSQTDTFPHLTLAPSPPPLLPPRSSVVREFRATATLTAAQLVTSWIQVSLTLVEARDTAERQLAAEERKKGGKVRRGGGGGGVAGESSRQ